MKKLFLAFSAGLMLLPATTLSARTPGGDEPHSTFQLTFFPPLGTNGFRAAQYTNDLSLNLLWGVSKNERAVALAGLANVVRGDADGFQAAGLVNYAGGEGRGAQLSGLANLVRGDFKGIQSAGLVNATGKVLGAQFGGLANLSDDLQGAQFSGLANLAGNVRGFQVADLLNAAGDVKGFQAAGLLNAAGNVHGLQAAGLLNAAGDVHGLQAAGLVNAAGRVHGVQLAGLVNIADHSDYPIGLVNIIKDGEMGVAVGYNELGTASVTLRSGGRVMYGILGAGFNHKAPRNINAVSIIGGFGAHVNIVPWLRINNELVWESLQGFSGENTFKVGYALLPAFRAGRRFEIFGGPNIGYMQAGRDNMRVVFPSRSIWKKDSGFQLQQVSVGWQVGVQYIF